MRTNDRHDTRWLGTDEGDVAYHDQRWAYNAFRGSNTPRLGTGRYAHLPPTALSTVLGGGNSEYPPSLLRTRFNLRRCDREYSVISIQSSYRKVRTPRALCPCVEWKGEEDAKGGDGSESRAIREQDIHALCYARA